jgi:capsular exopolysaccharide synthesis family protein
MGYLKIYLEIIRRRSFVILASFMIVMGSALVVALHLERGYEAAAMIDVQQSGPSPGATSLVRTVLLGGEESTLLETLSRRISTEAFLDSVVAEFERSYPRGAALLPSPGALVSRIKPQVIPGTRYIAIKVKLKEHEGGARNAAILANLAVKTLQETLSVENQERASAQIEFIDSKIREVREQVKSLKEKMLQFVRESGNPDIWTAQLGHLLAQQEAFLEERSRAELGVAASRESLRSIDDQLKRIPELSETARTISQSPLLLEQMKELAKLDAEIAGVKVGYYEDSDELKKLEAKRAEIERKIEELRNEMAISKTISTNPRYQQLLSAKLDGELGLIKYEMQIRMLDERLNKASAELRSLLNDIPEKRVEFEEITRHMEGAYELMKELLRRRIEAEIVLNEGNIISGTGPYTRKGGVMLIQPARPQLYPVSPNLGFILVISSVVGLALGLALAFSFEFLDGRFHSPSAASKSLGLPVLGTVSLRRKGFDGLPNLIDPLCRQAQEISGIAANLELMCEKEEIRSIVVVSCLRGEGRTTIAGGTAVSLAQMGKSVLLMDADLQNPSLHHLFGMDLGPGLIQIVDGGVSAQEATHSCDVPSLHIITAGTGVENPMAVLRSDRIKDLFEELKTGYEIVICDSPAVTSFMPGLIMASKADAALLVTDLNMVSSTTLTQTLDQLKKADIRLLGIVCNRIGS